MTGLCCYGGILIRDYLSSMVSIEDLMVVAVK